MKDKLTAVILSYLHHNEPVARIMWVVFFSLLPAGVAGIIIFGTRALWVIVAAVLTALASEALWQGLCGKKITISDGSAAVTGLLTAYILSPAVPLWIASSGAFFAVIIAKQIFGGLGKNIFNPALAARVFLLAVWPKYMLKFSLPQGAGQVDALTYATPLALIRKTGDLVSLSYADLFFGRHSGCIGEVCIFALLLGAGYLIYRRYISWHIPVTYLITFGIIIFVFGPKGLFSGRWLIHLLSGGIILGAFFMATDYVTSPSTHLGQMIFGAGCGLLTALFRLYGRQPEGVSFAILIMNAATFFFIDRNYRKTILKRIRKST